MKKYLLPILLLFSVLFTVPVYADELEDIVTVINSETSGSVVFCENNSNTYPSCSGFNYLLVSLDTGTSTRTYSSNIKLYFNVATDETRLPASPYVFDYSISIPSGSNRISITKPDWLTDGTITFTLSASGNCPSCPTCPEPQEPNRSAVMDDFHNVFMNTMLSVIPITAIIFVVWFFIDMLTSLVFGRGK